MNTQISTRLGVAHVRDTMEQFVNGTLSRNQAMDSLRIGQSRLYELHASYLAARAAGAASSWLPGRSGGNHKGEWPSDEEAFLRRALVPSGGAKPYSYAFAASELGRRFGHEVDRGQVRHWALEHGLRPALPKPRPLAHVRRWQRQAVGELWQLDATPDRFLGDNGTPVLQLLDMLDDCSRLQADAASIRANPLPRISTSSASHSRRTAFRWKSTSTKPASSSATAASRPSSPAA